MRLLFRDYVASLRERGELDRIVTDVLISAGLKVLDVPTLGMAEYGVDVAAVGPAKTKRRTLLLVQAKQGNITRRAWSVGPNSVRASLDEMLDHLDEIISRAGTPKPARVVVVIAHNGVLDRNVRSAFEGYRRRVARRDGITIERWDIHELVDVLMKYLFREQLFSSEQATQLRRALAFVEVPEYDLRHFERFLSETFATPVKSGRDSRRKLLQVQVALAMVIHYATFEAENLLTAVRAAERAFIRTYAWIYGREKLRDTDEYSQLHRLVDTYFGASARLLRKLDPLLDTFHGLALPGWHEAVEYPLRVVRLGSLTAQWLLFFRHFPRPLTPEAQKQWEFLRDFLVRLRGACPPVTRPLFDEQMTDVALIALAFYVLSGPTAFADYIDEVISRLQLHQMRDEPLPEGNGDFEAVAKLILENEKVAWYAGSSSTLLTMLAEMSALTGNDSDYQRIRATWRGKVNLQNCYLNGRFVEWACGSNAERKDDDVRVETSIDLPESADVFVREIDRKVDTDKSFRELLQLPLFELAYHTACRVNSIRLSPTTWRPLRVLTNG